MRIICHIAATAVVMVGVLALSLGVKTAVAESKSGVAVKSAWVRATPPNAKNSAAYLTVHNHSDQADRLIAAQSPIAQAVEIHTVVKKGELVAMQPVDHVPVPAQGMARLKPGGYHIMLINLKQPMNIDDQVHLTLTFERAGEVMVMAPVKEGSESVMKHDRVQSGMKHDDMKKAVTHGHVKTK